MSTVILEDLENENVDNVSCDLTPVHRYPRGNNTGTIDIVEFNNSHNATLDGNEDDISKHERDSANDQDVTPNFSGRHVWIEPEDKPSAENIERNESELPSSSQHDCFTNDKNETDISQCCNSDDISPYDLPSFLKTGTFSKPTEDSTSVADVLTEGFKVESSHVNDDNMSSPITINEKLQVFSTSSRLDSLKGKVGLFVSKIGLKKKDESPAPQSTSGENDDETSIATDQEISEKEESGDTPTSMTDKFNRLLRVVAIMMIVLSFFSIGVSVVKTTVLQPEKAVSLILSTVVHTLTDVMIIVPAVVGLAFKRIQARLQRDNPPTILKCCIPVHFGFSVSAVIFAVISFVASVSGLSVCSDGSCSDDQLLILVLEIIHIISALFTIAANIVGIVIFCKVRISILRVNPISNVTQKLHVLREKSINANIIVKLKHEANDKQ